MTIGRPCVEGEQCTKHTETNECEREPNALLGKGNSVGTTKVVGYFDDVHGLTTGTVEYTEYATHQEG